MQRAATGLATVLPAALLGRRLRTPGRAARRQRATTAATRCSPAPGSPRRGARVTRRPARPRPGARRRAGRAAAGRRARLAADAGAAPDRPRRPGGRRHRSASAAAAGCGRRRPRSPRRRPTARGDHRSPSTCRAGSTPTPARSTGAAVRADATVTFGALKPGLLVGDGRGARRRRCTSSTSGSARTCRRPTGVPAHRRRRRRPAAAAAAATTSTRRASSASSPARRPTRARRALHAARALRTRPGLVRYAGHGRRRRPRRAGPRRRHRRPARPTPGRVQAWVVGPGLGTDDAARSVLAEVLATDLPVVVDADALTLLARASRTLVRERDARRPCSPRTTASSPGSARDVGRRPGRRAPGGWPPTSARRAAQGRRDGRRRRRRHRVRQPAPAPRGWPPRAPATCSPASPARCSPPGLAGVEAGAVAAYLHGRAGQLAAERGPLLAGDLVRRLPEAIGRVARAARRPSWETRCRDQRHRPRRGGRSTSTPSRRTPRVLRERVGRPLMAVVKADGYGHGLVPAARAALAGGADALGVAVLEEALALRAAGITAPLLAWLHAPGTDFAAALAADVEVSVNAEWGLAEVVGGRPRHRPHRAAAPVRRHRALPRGRHAGRLAGAGRGGRPGAGRRRRSTWSGCGATWPTPTRPTHPDDRQRRCGSSRRRSAIARAAGLDRGAPAPGQLGGHRRAARHLVRHGPARHRAVRARPARRARPRTPTGCARR